MSRPAYGKEFFETNAFKEAKTVMAPMVDQSELAFRLLGRRHGVDICYTPMLHASSFVRDPKYRQEHLTTCSEDSPLIVQFCANQPETLCAAAKLCQNQCDAVDLNLGCPQDIARRGHYGSFLQNEWELIHKMVNICFHQLTVPISCKIRVFPEIEKTIHYAQMIEKAGAQMIAVHGRTKEQKRELTGLASWDHIKAIRESVNIPVIANGNIRSLSDVDKCLKETGVSAVMSAEGILHNPYIFTGENPCVWDVAKEYLSLVKAFPCRVSYVRGHLFKLMHYPCLLFPHLRDRLSMSKELTEIEAIVNDFVTQSQSDMLQYEANPDSFDRKGLQFPFWICQNKIRSCTESIKDQRDDPSTITSAYKSSFREQVNNLKLESGLSKKKVKKLLRHPGKQFGESRKIYQRCSECENPKCEKCSFSMCKNCCHDLCKLKRFDCTGHFFRFSHFKDLEIDVT